MVSDAFSCDLKTFEIEILSNHRNDWISSIQSCFSSNLVTLQSSSIVFFQFQHLNIFLEMERWHPLAVLCQAISGHRGCTGFDLGPGTGHQGGAEIWWKEAGGHGGRSMHVCIDGRCLFNFSMVVTWHWHVSYWICFNQSWFESFVCKASFAFHPLVNEHLLSLWRKVCCVG